MIILIAFLSLCGRSSLSILRTKLLPLFNKLSLISYNCLQQVWIQFISPFELIFSGLRVLINF